jgi:putative CocE/NonD family hydrolase
MRNHPDRDGFWDQFDLTPIVRECDIPTVYVGVWYDHFIRGTCEAHELHRGPSHLILTPGQQGTHGIHADVNANERRLRWFDYHLKGIDNGVMDEPPVKAFVMGVEEWRTFGAWPPPGEMITYALSSDGSLVERQAARPFEDAFEHDPADPIPGPADIQDIRDYEERALTYTSAPLESDLTLVGSAAVRLFLRSTAEDAHVMVKLADVFPDGRSRLVTFGRLRAAHSGGHERAEALVPGETAELAISFWPTANTFRAGHRVRLAVAGSEVSRCEVCPYPSSNVLTGDAGHAAVLQLPSPSAAS